MQSSGVASGVYAATETTNYTTTEFVGGGARGDGATDIHVAREGRRGQKM